jgi:nitroreductase
MHDRPVLDHHGVTRQLKWRYATQKFDPAKKIPDAAWKALEAALVLSPSSFGLQPWKFFVVEHPDVRERLMAASWGQRQIVDASHLVVFTVRSILGSHDADRHVRRTAEVREISEESLSRFRKAMHTTIASQTPEQLQQWSARQVYIALGQFMTTAAMLGIDTCPMEGLEPGRYDVILNLTEAGYTTLAACPAGYRADDDPKAAQPKVRFRTHEVVEYVK